MPLGKLARLGKTAMRMLRRDDRNAMIDGLIRERLSTMLRKTDIEQHPNISELWFTTKDIDLIKLNIKTMGYQLARDLRKALPAASGAPQHVGLSSRPTRQAEVETPWFAYWCQALNIPVVYHRKIWEYAFVLQTLHDAGLLKPGARGLGFGCGEEPLPSYFAARGMNITVTDLDPQMVQGKGWVETGQHSESLESVYYDDLVDRAIFDAAVSLRYVDMTDIPADITGYDFNWSICALEHLGSIKKGLDFIENSLTTLRPGGMAVHTTEFNYLNDEETVDNWMTVLFQRKHFQELADRLTAKGHHVAPLSFDVGDGPMDQFIDLPPFEWGRLALTKANRQSPAHDAHLKLAIDGFASTCFGFVVTKKAD